MNKLMLKSTAILMLLIFMGCSKVPITNRRQTKLLNEADLIAMAETEYANFLAENPPLPESDDRVERVRRVGNKIKENIVAFLNKNNASSRVDGFVWRFEVVDQPVVNAWCMPGGYVVVYTEILKLAETDDELAVIMGHEIAHAIARHGNERMSNGTLVNVGSVLLGGGGTDENGEANNNKFLQSYGIVTQLGMLKYSRKNETESDKLGLVFMTLAGYKPEAAIDFWTKMSELGGEKPPVLMSTHPSDDQRISDIKEFIPEIPKYTKED